MQISLEQSTWICDVHYLKVHPRLWKAPVEVFQCIWRAQYQAESVLKIGGWLCEMLCTLDILLFERSCLSFFFHLLITNGYHMKK